MVIWADNRHLGSTHFQVHKGIKNKRNYAKEGSSIIVQDANLPPVGQIPTGTLLYQGRYRITLVWTITPTRALYRVWDNNVQRSALILELSTPSRHQAALALEHAAPLLELDHPGISAIEVIFMERDTLFMGMAFSGGQNTRRHHCESQHPHTGRFGAEMDYPGGRKRRFPRLTIASLELWRSQCLGIAGDL